MDTLTHAALARLRLDGRASYSAIARELGVSHDAIAKRLRPLLEDGSLSVVTSVHPKILGLAVAAHITIRAIGPSEPLIARLLKLSPNAFIAEVAGEFSVVCEAWTTDLEGLRSHVIALRGLPGVVGVRVNLYQQVLSSFFPHGPISATELGPVDRLLLDALSTNGRATFAELAAASGLSVSGARSRVRRLYRSNMVRVGLLRQRAIGPQLLVGWGFQVDGGSTALERILLATSGTEYVVRTIGQWDVMATVEFQTYEALQGFLGRLHEEPSVREFQQWLHVRIHREHYTDGSFTA